MKTALSIVAIAFLWTAAVIYGSLVPFRFHTLTWDQIVELAANMRFLELSIQSRADLVANGVLFAPCGLLWSAGLSWRMSTSKRFAVSFFVSVMLGMLVFGLEVLQLMFTVRTVSWNDIVSEWIGISTGALFWACFGDTAQEWIKKNYGGSREETFKRLLDAYCVALLIYAVAPFDLVLNWAEFKVKIENGSVGWGYVTFQSSMISILLFSPIGVLLRLRQFRFPMFWGLVISVAIELIQLPIFSRSAHVLHVAPSFVGILLGFFGVTHASLARSTKERTCSWWLPTSMMGIINLAAWYPFHLDTDWQSKIEHVSFIPFASHYKSPEYQVFSNFLIRAASFGAVGAGLFLVRRISRRVRNLAVIGFVLWAMSIEFGQVGFVGRSSTIEDAILSALAMGAGHFVCARLHHLAFKSPNQLQR